MLQTVIDINRSGKAPSPITPASSNFIPSDPTADDLGLTVVLMTSNGQLVSADPVPASLEGGLQFGDPQLNGLPVYAMLCTSVADQQLGESVPEQGAYGDAFSGVTRCGKIYYVGIVSALSESFEAGGKRMITLNLVLSHDMQSAPWGYPQRSLATMHVNAAYIDYSVLFTHDLVLYPAYDVVEPGASTLRHWTCSLSEAPTTSVINGSISDDGAMGGGIETFFATVFPPGDVTPLLFSENVIGTLINVTPSAEGSPQYTVNSTIFTPVAYSFAKQSFYWFCIGYKFGHGVGYYLAQSGSPLRVLAAIQNSCGLAVGPLINS